MIRSTYENTSEPPSLVSYIMHDMSSRKLLNPSRSQAKPISPCKYQYCFQRRFREVVKFSCAGVMRVCISVMESPLENHFGDAGAGSGFGAEPGFDAIPIPVSLGGNPILLTSFGSIFFLGGGLGVIPPYPTPKPGGR